MSEISQIAIDMVLYCPRCLGQHADKAEPENGWTNPLHKSHLCAFCSYIWRPADVFTNGVEAIKTRGERDTVEPKPDDTEPERGVYWAIAEMVKGWVVTCDDDPNYWEIQTRFQIVQSGDRVFSKDDMVEFGKGKTWRSAARVELLPRGRTKARRDA